jgi:hypothetical protein
MGVERAAQDWENPSSGGCCDKLCRAAGVGSDQGNILTGDIHTRP